MKENPMSTPRKRHPRSTEHQEAAESAAWDNGFECGMIEGREHAMYDIGHQQGYEKGFADASCHAYDAGYADAKAGKPPQHKPHTVPENVSELLNHDAHD
jgi:hypothetical protein